ncbi:hypothetical protein M9H77_05813 [Catharanthus roseus]|uniref:Uncharacterized protein n=1 Tax=Catharanthus roseus TaxID=4058 RepID=A0ACC0BQP9_CATRO|nr:hypothetical protein M9H77_05813 [Catharanthus roseus]
MEKNGGLPLNYWLQWQVLVCALIFALPATIAAVLIRRRKLNSNGNFLNSAHLWLPCWRHLHPRWLLFYRAFAFLSMAFLLYQLVLAFGFFVFFFYTQWTFVLVTGYFALATLVSARGCWMHSRIHFVSGGERTKFNKKHADKNGEEYETFKHKETSGVLIDQEAGFWENLMHYIYQTCAGAVMLTDIVFWCLLLPFMSGEDFKLTLLIGIMHSVNAVFLIVDSALNSLVAISFPRPFHSMGAHVVTPLPFLHLFLITESKKIYRTKFPLLSAVTQTQIGQSKLQPSPFFALSIVHAAQSGSIESGHVHKHRPISRLKETERTQFGLQGFRNLAAPTERMMDSRHCQFWLPRKNRYCANIPLSNSSSVLQENLESHLKRCPLLKQVKSLSLQPYYQKGINAGVQDPGQPKAADLNSESKRKAVYARTVPEFFELLRKIKCIHASICSDTRDSFKNPEACATWTNRQIDRKLPFQEKHVLQQASILGNLEDFGVLKRYNADVNSRMSESDASADDKNVDAVVEFGAGRGYLTQMLADCYGIKKVLLVERRSYKLKADRSLRQIESLSLERVRIDSKVFQRAFLKFDSFPVSCLVRFSHTALTVFGVEDFNLNGVQSFQGVNYVAIGKHLCGSATDMALKCCTVEQCMQDGAAQPKTSSFLKGLAIATCCHHLCQWKHYINRTYMLHLGLNMEDFHAITWFTSWAVDAEHRIDLSSRDLPRQLDFGEKEEIRLESGECEVGEVVRNMKAEERALLGFMCKEIIDAGRLMWLKEQLGLQAEIVNYVPQCISPENHLLIATRK